MTKNFHMGIDVQGAQRMTDRQLSALFTESDGSHRSGKYVRDYLKLQHYRGVRVLPMSDCPDWNFQTGCPGHPVEEEQP